MDVDRVWEMTFAAAFAREAETRYAMRWAENRGLSISDVVDRDKEEIANRAAVIADAAAGCAADIASYGDAPDTEPAPKLPSWIIRRHVSLCVPKRR